jgi:hypothetical protein
LKLKLTEWLKFDFNTHVVPKLYQNWTFFNL